MAVPQIPSIPVAAGAPPELAGAVPPPPVPLYPAQFDAMGNPISPGELMGEPALDPYAEPLPWPPDTFFPDGQATAGGPPAVDASLGGAEQPQAPVREPDAPPGVGKMGPPQTALEPDAVSGAGAPVATSKSTLPPAAPIDPYAPAQPREGDPYLNSLEDSAEIRSRAELQKAEAEKAKNEYLEQEGARIAQEQAARQAKADAAYQQVYDEAKKSRAALDKEAQEIANTKLDDQRVWKDAGMPVKIGLAVAAMMVGRTSRTIQTGRNPVTDAVTAIVDRDLKLQAADLENRRAGIATRRGLLADDMAAGRDMLDVQYKAMNAAYDIAGNAMKARALKFNNPVIDAQTATALADIHDAKVQMGMKYEQDKQQQIYERWKEEQQLRLQRQGMSLNERQFAYSKEKDRLEREAAGQPKPLSVREAVSLSKEEREAEQDRAGRKVHLAKKKDGKEVYGPTPTVTAEVNSAMDTATTTTQKLERLEQIYTKNGWSPLGAWGTDGEDAKEAAQIFEELLTDFSLMKEQGVIRDGEYKRYEKMFGSPTGFLDPRPNLKAAKRGVVQGMNNKLQARIGPDVAYWSPATTAENKDYFNNNADPKFQPAPAGLPAADGKPAGATEPASPAEERLIREGKFTPSAPASAGSADDLVRVKSARGERLVPRTDITPGRYRYMPDGSLYDDFDEGDDENGR